MVNFKSILTNATFHRIVLSIIVIITLMVLFNTCKEHKRSTLFLEQNIKALKDSTMIWKDKYGTEYSENYTLLMSVDSLSGWSKKLQGKIDSLKRATNGSDVLSATEMNILIRGLEGNSTNTQMFYENGRGAFSWWFDKKEEGFNRFLSGKTDFEVNYQNNKVNIIPGNTTIIKDAYDIEVFTYTVVNDDNSISVIASSPSKNVSIKQLKQVIDPIVIRETVDKYLPPDTKDIRINWGIQTGLGVNPLRINDPITGQFQPVVYVGVGLQFQLGTLLEFDFDDLNPF